MAPLSRSRAAGVALATLFVLAAASPLAGCGGGGGSGGSNPPPPPPPPVDTVAAKLASTKPANGAKDVNDGATTLTAVMNEAITCPKTNPVTTLVDGQEVKGGTYACDGPTGTLSVTGTLFCGKVYTAKLAAGVEDMAGNKSVAYEWSFSTKACPVRMVFTANDEAKLGAAAVTGIDLSDGATTSYLPNAGKVTAAQVAVVADAENGTVYSASWDGFRGLDIIDVATGNTTSTLLAPDAVQHVEALALKGQYAWAAYSNQWVADPESVNRLFMLDRATKHLAGKTAAVTDSGKTPLRLVPRSDATKHRLYVLNAALAGMLGTDCSMGPCRRNYLPGTAGTMTEVNSDTGAILRTFAVGSVPTDACINEATNTAYTVNAGDKSLSKVNLDTGAVATTTLSGFTGFQQPVGIACFADKLWVSDYVDSVRVLDPATLSEVGKVPVGALSVPKTMVPLGDKLYVALLKGNAVVEIASNKTVLRTMATGPGPADIAAYVK